LSTSSSGSSEIPEILENEAFKLIPRFSINLACIDDETPEPCSLSVYENPPFSESIDSEL